LINCAFGLSVEQMRLEAWRGEIQKCPRFQRQQSLSGIDDMI
jgi:hypothetical protein